MLCCSMEPYRSSVVHSINWLYHCNHDSSSLCAVTRFEAVCNFSHRLTLQYTYTLSYKHPAGPGNARLTALQVVDHEHMLSKLQHKVIFWHWNRNGPSVACNWCRPLPCRARPAEGSDGGRRHSQPRRMGSEWTTPAPSGSSSRCRRRLHRRLIKDQSSSNSSSLRMMPACASSAVATTLTEPSRLRCNSAHLGLIHGSVGTSCCMKDILASC